MGKTGDFMLFDVVGKKVVRRVQPSFLAKDRYRRSVVERYLPVPAVEYLEHGWTVEDMVEGQSVFGLQGNVKLAVYRDLVRRYLYMASISEKNDATNVIEALRADIGSLQTGFVEIEHQLRRFERDWPTFPMHGDLSGSNLIWADGTYTAIDFDDVSVQPFFYDLLLFVFRDSYLREAIRPEQLEFDLLRVACAAGCQLSGVRLSSCIDYVVLSIAVDRCRATEESIIVALNAVRRRFGLYQ